MNIMKFMRNNKFFTLIELIVVIVVLSILAAIVIPNISSFQEEAEEKAMLSNARNIQTAVDMFVLYNNGETPTKDTPTFGNPEIIETYGMKPDYLRDLPKTKRAKYWLDYNNTVWASMVDAPQNVDYTGGKVTWNTVDGAVLYKIYKSEDVAVSSVKGAKGMKFVDNTSPVSGGNQSKELPVLTKGTYLVTAIDKFDFESPPTKVGTNYNGYGEGPDKDFTLNSPKVPSNQNPIAVIGMVPSENIDTNTTISWDYNKSNDAENHKIISAEWRLNGVIVDNLPTKLPEGENIVELRVKDEKDAWSKWEVKTVTVKKGSFTPTTVSASKSFAQMTYSAYDAKIQRNGDNTEVFYYPSNCCMQDSFIKDVFDKDGKKISSTIITGFTGNKNNFAVSNLDENGNRYILTLDGQVFILSQDSKASFFANFSSQLTTNTYKQISKFGIAVEGNRLYIGYNSDTSLGKPHLAIINRDTKQVMSNQLGLDSYMSNSDNVNVVVTKDYIYTSALTGHEDSPSQTFIIKWDKITGKMVKYYIPQQARYNYTSPILFVDSNDGLWFSEARTYQDGNRIQLKRVNTEKMDSVVGTVAFPDLSMYKADAAFVKEDGSILIFEFNYWNQIKMVEFK